MAIPSSGPLALTTIQTEFGGSNPISLNEYYAGGAYVASGTSGTYGAVPSSGAISIQNFYGTANVVGKYVLISGITASYQNSYNLKIDSSGNVYIASYSSPDTTLVKFDSSYNVSYSRVGQLGGGAGGSQITWYTSGGYSWGSVAALLLDSAGNSILVSIGSGANTWNSGTTVVSTIVKLNSSGSVVATAGYEWYAQYATFGPYAGYTTYLNYFIPRVNVVGPPNVYGERLLYTGYQCFQYVISGYSPCPCGGCPIPNYVIQSQPSMTQFNLGTWSSNNTYFPNLVGGTTNSSNSSVGVNQSNGNYYFSFVQISGSDNKNVLMTFNENGTLLSQKFYTVAGNAWILGFTDGKWITDTSNNLYFTGGGGTNHVVKLDSSGNYVGNVFINSWPVSIPYGNYIDSVIDSSNNIYILYYGTVGSADKTVLVKYNSSLVLQWTRVFSGNVSTGSTSGIPSVTGFGIDIKPGSTDVTLNLQVTSNNGASYLNYSYKLIVTYPQSGSFTGATNVTIPGSSNVLTFTIASDSVTTINKTPAPTVTTSSFSNVGFVGAGITSSIAPYSSVSLSKTIKDF